MTVQDNVLSDTVLAHVVVLANIASIPKAIVGLAALITIPRDLLPSKVPGEGYQLEWLAVVVFCLAGVETSVAAVLVLVASAPIPDVPIVALSTAEITIPGLDGCDMMKPVGMVLDRHIRTLFFQQGFNLGSVATTTTT